VCANNASEFGYIAVLDSTKVVIYLAQTEEQSITYDEVYRYDFWRLRRQGLGETIDKIDFTMSCKEFIGLTSKGAVCRFGLRDKSVMKLSTVLNYDMPVSICKSVGENGEGLVITS
jgi:hypothetical protein